MPSDGEFDDDGSVANYEAATVADTVAVTVADTEQNVVVQEDEIEDVTLSSAICDTLQSSFPLFISNFAASVATFISMAMLCDLDDPDILAASSYIAALSTTVIALVTIPTFMVGAFAGYLNGQNNFNQIGNVVQQGWVMGVLMGAVFIPFTYYISPILTAVDQDSDLADMTQEFGRSLIYALPVVGVASANFQFLTAVDKITPMAIINTLGALINVLASYVLINGSWGFPKLRIAGYGYAMVVQFSFNMLMTFLYFLFSADMNKYDIYTRFECQASLTTFLSLMGQGLLIELSVASELVSVLLTTFIIGKLGSNALSQNNIISQYLFFMILPLFTLRQVTMNKVSNTFGLIQQFRRVNPINIAAIESNINTIKQYTYSSLIIGVSIAGIFTLLTAEMPKILAQPFVDGDDPNKDAVISGLNPAFTIIAAGQMADTVRNILGASLNGMSDTKSTAWSSFVCMLIIALALAYLFAYQAEMGLSGVALGHDVALVLGAIILTNVYSSSFGTLLQPLVVVQDVTATQHTLTAAADAAQTSEVMRSPSATQGLLTGVPKKPDLRVITDTNAEVLREFKKHGEFRVSAYGGSFIGSFGNSSNPPTPRSSQPSSPKTSQPGSPKAVTPTGKPKKHKKKRKPKNGFENFDGIEGSDSQSSDRDRSFSENSRDAFFPSSKPTSPATSPKPKRDDNKEKGPGNSGRNSPVYEGSNTADNGAIRVAVPGSQSYKTKKSPPVSSSSSSHTEAPATGNPPRTFGHSSSSTENR